jgi:hypothetical protein
VVYDDGDNEDLGFIELRKILEDPAVIVYPAVMPRAFPTESQVASVVSAHKKSRSQGAAAKKPDSTIIVLCFVSHRIYFIQAQ